MQNKRAIELERELEQQRICEAFSEDITFDLESAYTRYLRLGGQAEESEFVDKIRQWWDDLAWK